MLLISTVLLKFVLKCVSLTCIILTKHLFRCEKILLWNSTHDRPRLCPHFFPQCPLKTRSEGPFVARSNGRWGRHGWAATRTDRSYQPKCWRSIISLIVNLAKPSRNFSQVVTKLYKYYLLSQPKIISHIKILHHIQIANR